MKRTLSLAIFLTLTHYAPATSEDFKHLDLFSQPSGSKVLNLELKVETKKVTVGGYRFETEVFNTCSGTGKQKRCSSNLYGGPRIAVKPGSTLKINFHNHADDFCETNPVDELEYVVSQSLNNHTHGLIVRANGLRQDTQNWLPGDPDNGTIGDFALKAVPSLYAGKKQPCKTSAMTSGHSMNHGPAATIGHSLKYEIQIPGGQPSLTAKAGSHPEGIFWFHPHVHGLAKEQVSAGLTGMLNIGSIWNYVCLLPNEDGTCGDKKQLGKNAPFLRHMLLKDIQLVDTDGPQSKPKVLRDQSASFCGDNLYSYPDPANPSQTLANKGLCSQTENTNGQIKIKGRWLQTINGAVYPKWNFSTDKPEIWRIQNASANLSYDLRLISAAWPDSADGAMPFQIVSIDGGAFGGGGDVNAPDLGFNTPEKLQRRMVLMPGSRAEILVTYRDPANCKLSPSKTTALCGAVIPPTTPQKITLQTNLFNTGDGGEIGDKWPQVQLAEVTITGGAQKILTSQTVAVLQDKTIAFSDAERQVASQNAKQKNNLGVVISPEATALCERKSAYRLDPAIEKRRIYFGIAVNPNKPNPIEEKANWREESFLMGNSIVRDNIEYEETPTGLVELPNGPILRPVNMNNMMPDGPSDLCIPFDTEEDWELVNVSPEVHNFHIHQNKFTVLQEQSKRRIRSPYDRLSMPSFGAGGSQSAEHDTVIVPRGVGTDCNTLIEPDPNDTTTLQQFIPIFRAGNEGNWDKLEGYHIRKQSKCRGNADDTSGMMTVHIPFTRKEVIGKYLFHCHILEHEDLGMMSTVRVLRP